MKSVHLSIGGHCNTRGLERAHDVRHQLQPCLQCIAVPTANQTLTSSLPPPPCRRSLVHWHCTCRAGRLYSKLWAVSCLQGPPRISLRVRAGRAFEIMFSGAPPSRNPYPGATRLSKPQEHTRDAGAYLASLRRPCRSTSGWLGPSSSLSGNGMCSVDQLVGDAGQLQAHMRTSRSAVTQLDRAQVSTDINDPSAPKQVVCRRA